MHPPPSFIANLRACGLLLALAAASMAHAQNAAPAADPQAPKSAAADPEKKEAKAAKEVKEAEPFPISIKIRNTSMFPVRVDLPGLMQANFLPFSESGASVPFGQEIYFQYEGKRTLLFKFESTERVQEIIINEVVAKRRAELRQAQRAAAQN